VIPLGLDRLSRVLDFPSTKRLDGSQESGQSPGHLVPSVAVAFGVFALFIIRVEVFVRSAVASALLRGPDLLAQLVFTPPLPPGRSGSASPYRQGRTIPASQGSSPCSSPPRLRKSDADRTGNEEPEDLATNAAKIDERASPLGDAVPLDDGSSAFPATVS
jgi:hypothetical protein